LLESLVDVRILGPMTHLHLKLVLEIPLFILDASREPLPVLGEFGIRVPLHLKLLVRGTPVGLWPDEAPTSVAEALVSAGHEAEDDLDDGVEDDGEHDDGGEDPPDAVAPRRQTIHGRVVNEGVNEEEEEQDRRRDGPREEPVEVGLKSEHQLAVLAEVPEAIDPHEGHAFREGDEEHDESTSVGIEQIGDQPPGLTGAREREEEAKERHAAADQGLVGAEDPRPLVREPGDDGLEEGEL